MTRSRLADILLAVFLAVLPFGTRYIFRTGQIGGVAIEPGTVSIFVTQLFAFAVVTALWLGSAKEDRGRALRAPATILGLVLVAIVAIESVVVGGITDGTFMTVSWTALGFCLFVALMARRPDWRIAAVGLVAGGVFQAVLAWWQFVSQQVFATKWLGMAAHSAGDLGASVVETFDERWLRAYGTTSHPNILGAYLALTVIAAVGLAVLAGSRRWRIASLSTTPILVSGILFTFSRAASLALVVGVVVFAVLAWRKLQLEEKRRLGVAVFAILATLAALTMALSGPLATRLSSTARLERRSLDERGSAARQAVSLFFSAPLFGVGPGRSVFALDEKFSGHVSVWELQPAHDVPLLLLAETGLVGFLFFAAFVIFAVNRRAPPLSLALLITLAIVSLFDHFLWSSWFGQAIFFSVIGLFADPLYRERIVHP